MLVWRVVKGLPWRRPGNSQPSCGGCGRIQQACRVRRGADTCRLRALRSDLIDPTIAVHNGRIVKRTGDGVLIESEASSMPFAAQSRCRMA